MKKITAFLLSLGAVLSFSTFLAPNPVGAACDAKGSDRVLLVFIHSWDYGLDHEGADENCHVVIKGDNSIPKFVWTVVLNILYDISALAGIVAVVMIIINGFQYMTSGGSTDKVSNAKKGLMQSIVGLVIALLAATIVNFIVSVF